MAKPLTLYQGITEIDDVSWGNIESSYGKDQKTKFVEALAAAFADIYPDREDEINKNLRNNDAVSIPDGEKVYNCTILFNKQSKTWMCTTIISSNTGEE
ncbi:hypothetical protein GGI06_000723 [Coemansia sp. S85]|nr:hypothetical protein GGI06_000723 [Coemansia sp. S85]